MVSSAQHFEFLRAGIKRASELNTPKVSNLPAWCVQSLLGRISLIVGDGNTSAAAHLIATAQQQHEPCAWLTQQECEPYIPDLESAGIAIGALVTIRLNDEQQTARVADLLARSGGVGLMIIDAPKNLTIGLLKRLSKHAAQHRMAVVILAERIQLPHAFSLIVKAQPTPAGTQHIQAIKDRIKTAKWQHTEFYHAVPGCP